jgi:VWFA-related protein
VNAPEEKSRQDAGATKASSRILDRNRVNLRLWQWSDCGEGGAVVKTRLHLLVACALEIGVIAPLLLCVAPMAHAQQGQETATESEAQLIRIDAVVTGKDGKPIEDAWPQSFSLQEDGLYQSLVSVEHFAVVNSDTWAESDESPIMIDLQTPNDIEKLMPIARNHRMIVLFFDLTSIADEDVERSVAASQKFVKEQMTPADLVAVVSFGTQFKIISGFTNNRETLDHTLALLVRGKDSELQRLAAITGKQVDDDGSLFDADTCDFNIFNTDNKLYAVQALAGILGGIPGRKSVIEFTGSRSPIGEESQSALRGAINAANTNAVSLYIVDLFEPASSSQSGEPDQADTEDQGATGADQFVNQQDSRKALASLAKDAGGKLFADVKDFSPIFRQVQQDSQDYYVLAYYSSNDTPDGAFRNVSVILEGNEGAQILSRPGYYAPGSLGVR